MSAALDMVVLAKEAEEPYGGKYTPPRIERPPYTRRELYEIFRGGETEADECEAFLAGACRARAAIDLTIGEGLVALRRGTRLARLGFHLVDYGREVLGISERTTRSLARLARNLRSRPILREGVRSGRVKTRAAQTMVPVARGDAETTWVEKAATMTVRELEAAIRSEGKEPGEQEEDWLRFSVRVTDEERVPIDGGLSVAARLLPDSIRPWQYEAMAQELRGPACRGAW